MQNLIKRINKSDFKLFLFIAVFYLIMQLAGITCPILFITGISCAGCGMTRAWLSFFKGDFLAAFHYHPLFWLVIPTFFVWVYKNKINKTIYRLIMNTFILLFLGVYIYRLLLGHNDIVVFRPREGFVYRIILFIYQLIF